MNAVPPAADPLDDDLDETIRRWSERSPGVEKLAEVRGETEIAERSDRRTGEIKRQKEERRASTSKRQIEVIPGRIDVAEPKPSAI